jgi:hypothetical protein
MTEIRASDLRGFLSLALPFACMTLGVSSALVRGTARIFCVKQRPGSETDRPARKILRHSLLTSTVLAVDTVCAVRLSQESHDGEKESPVC